MRSPLRNLHRLVVALLLGLVLLYSPRNLHTRKQEAPAVWVTDIAPEGSQAVNLPPPAKPFPKQLTTCRPRVHTLISGGCWRKLADGPPCEEAYLWQGACYLPVMQAERIPTSISR